jgi:hypothetical protein
VSLGEADLIYGLAPTYPANNVVSQNHIHDIGIFGKQTSCYFQAITANVTLKSNICYNGPRAGINFNDGFFGSHRMEGNLIFNMVRETGDHGPFNSWDRQPYITRNGVDDGFSEQQRGAPSGTSIIAQPSIITKNLIINGYNGVWSIDHDDGSQYFNDTENVLVWGGCKNFLGHSKSCDNNLIMYPEKISGHGCQTDDNSVFANQYFHDNDCMTGDGHFYSFGGCSPSNLATTVYQTWENRFYSPDGVFQSTCGLSNFTAWQAAGQDQKSVVAKTPSVDTILRMAELKLGLQPEIVIV